MFHLVNTEYFPPDPEHHGPSEFDHPGLDHERLPKLLGPWLKRRQKMPRSSFCKFANDFFTFENPQELVKIVLLMIVD